MTFPEYYKKLSTYSLLFWLVLVGLLWSCTSKADIVNIQIGQSVWERPENTLWHDNDSGFPADFNLKSAFIKIGYDAGHVEVSAFSLGKYSIDAIATREEKCILAGGTSYTCGGITDRYITSGNIYGASLTLNGSLWNLYGKAGPTLYRQTFKLDKTHGDGQEDYSYSEHLWGTGYVIEAGIRVTKKLTLSTAQYVGNVGRKFNRNEFPAGTGYKTKVYAIGVLSF